MRKNIIRTVRILLAAFLLLCCTVTGGSASEIGLLRHIEYNGADYVEKTDMTPILVMGIDQTEDGSRKGSRNGGQADFILLVMIDHRDKVIRPLEIDRDTIMEVPTASVFGQRDGTRSTQICLTHAFGGGGQMGCEFMTEALEGFLDMEIPLYVSFDLDTIGKINDALGGVPVVVTDDFSELDPEMTPGAKLTLNARQAEHFVRGRMNVGDGTNASRMQRQRAYLAAAGEKAKERLHENSAFFDQLFDLLEEDMVTNLSRGRLINEMNRAVKYDILPVETLTGEYTIGNDGFVEFHADGDFVRDWVFKNCFMLNSPY